MKHDIFGLPTSLSRATSITEWNATILGFLAHDAATPEHLGKVLTAEPEFALGQAVKGMFYLLLGRRELYQIAEQALATARTACTQGSVTARERLYVEALEVCVAGWPTRAVAKMEDVLRADPQDSLAMKMSQALRFVLGDPKGMRRSVERVMPAYGSDHPGHGYLLGCHAFALEETGEYERAGITGRKALWTAPDDAWGLHAVTHVHDMTGNARQGLNWLEGREAAWAHCNNFRYHVWWHKALMHLDVGEIDEVFDLYDREIRHDKTDDYRDISNGTGLLMRMELNGIDVGSRWEELAELCAARTEDGCVIFADLHYLLALGSGRRDVEANRMMARIGRDARAGGNDTNQRMAEPGLAAATGLQAFGQGRFGEAFRALAQARDTMQLAGGSHAQRDVFERMTIDAGLRSGYFDEAERILNDRQSRRAGRDDGYASARRDLIAAGRGVGEIHSVPAQ